MPQSKPHPDALFSLVPLNAEAAATLKHPHNIHLVSVFTDPENGIETFGIDVGLQVNSPSNYTLATLGRSGTDITLEGSSISRIQCSFEIHEEFGTVLLSDRSTTQSTQVFGENAIPFLSGQTRRVIVAKGVNTTLGMAGAGCQVLLFKLVWHKEAHNWKDIVKTRIENLCLARTVDDTPTAASSRYLTRIHTQAASSSRFRCARLNRLGAGNFGEVWRAIAADSGMLMAVKTVNNRASCKNDMEWNSVKREIKILAKLSHPHIVGYIGVQPVLEHVDIFMALKDGSVQDLVHQKVFEQPIFPHPADFLLHHVLKGIDYLETQNIVHRDLKPENILFTRTGKFNFHFTIADFGVSKFASNARTLVGTLPYAAPEVLYDTFGPQTSKADVWSLFVTIAYVIDVDSYQGKGPRTPKESINDVLAAAKNGKLVDLKTWPF
ncbi:uncharacterized protein Z520_08277 [Fonsecaea multimorphosa CBS 102226]|uniref:Serine/threonine-protein kinase ATG1 n=1 Tax=Fonsecaea multimorphosa CBS 102226 TaxID=1442371 RepID=A0A0D2JRH8_9EURO|nr:uncharacterized protein Z520_08277 [Fonsecaea multimorphosa CBS 102226]KIX96022.1 hypothetical protein Z520_08277 [Fonsecaea multimorphosa CBS 102226]OAL21791.1 hypothetical protein AYO22_07733 [Fonsecaea multimorphosa]